VLDQPCVNLLVILDVYKIHLSRYIKNVVNHLSRYIKNVVNLDIQKNSHKVNWDGGSSF
jgi:hypothetical protein